MSPRSACFVFAAMLALILAGCLCHKAPAVVSGVLDGDIVWEGAVRLGGDVVLAPGAHLVIRPGTTVTFLPPPGFPGGLTEHPHFPGSELIVKGKVTAIGTRAAPITFRAEDGAAPPGSWGAVNFEEGADGRFAFCVFRQADSAVHAWSARVSIEESLFEENLVGIRFNDSRMQVEHNLLRNNGAAIRFHFGAPVIRSNRLEGNRVNLFVTSHPHDYLFENNWFEVAHDYQVVLGEEVPEDVQLAGNYWEGVTATIPAAGMFDGHRVAYLGRVLAEPALSCPPAGAGPSWIR